MEFKIEAITFEGKKFETDWQNCGDYDVEHMNQLSETMSKAFRSWNISYR